MIFKCFVCDKYKLKNKKSFKLVIGGQGYTKTHWMCRPCGELFPSDIDFNIDEQPEPES